MHLPFGVKLSGGQFDKRKRSNHRNCGTAKPRRRGRFSPFATAPSACCTRACRASASCRLMQSLGITHQMRAKKKPRKQTVSRLLAERAGFEPTDGCPSTDFERICFPPFCRRQRGLWVGRRDLRTPSLRDPGGAKGRKTLIFQWVPGFFFIQTTFRFFRAETAKPMLPRSPVFQLFSARKPTYTHFARKTTQKIRECTEVLWWGCSLLRRADGKEQRWQNRRKPSTPSTSAT